jgi:hypothetical protein
VATDSGAADSIATDSAAKDSTPTDTGVVDSGADARSDAPADVASDASEGGLEAGAHCTSDGECASGLKCCYPCGIPGCTNSCMAPTSAGTCPLFP